jgi:mannose/fructose/N-acetylgalactosamine-specific phosphotransferase system component IID
LKIIQQKNENQTESGYKLGVNFLTDYTDEEIQKLMESRAFIKN